MTTISSLPDEVLSHCFTFCEWNDIICIELVCHRWKFIIRDDKEWMRRLCIPSTSAYPPTQLEDPESLALFVFSSSSPASLQSQPNLNGSCGQGEEVEGEEEMDQPLQSPTRSAPRLRIPKPSSSAADYLSDDIAFETLKAANKVPPALSLRERVGEGYANVLYPTLSLMPASLSDWIKEDEVRYQELYSSW